MAVTTRTVYLKMETATGTKVYRNMLQSNGSNKLNFVTGNVSSNDIQEALTEFIGSFVPVQTEDLYLDTSNSPEVKVVTEEVVNITGDYDFSTLKAGSDAWEDVTDEYLLTTYTTGDKEYKIRLNKAASATPAGSTTSYEDAVLNYVRAIKNVIQNPDDYAYLNCYLKGTKSSLVGSAD